MSEPTKYEQTMPQDDFEEACKKSGIEITEVPPKDVDDEGKGASEHLRTSAPSYDNPWYISTAYGGYNRCIIISGKSCLPNCVGYAHGAFLEEVGDTSNWRVPTCNARDFLAVAKRNGLPTGSEPKLGAIIVWWSDGFGHVGIVVGISGSTITVAQSNYGGTRFFLTNHTKPYNIYGQTCIGFIYNPKLDGKWKKNDIGWWWERGDGSYPINEWEYINGKWYHFDSKGYMQTGWLKDDGKWYYLNSDGDMATGWVKDGGKWYYMDSDGAMETGWVKDDGKWYYLNSDGAMRTGWLNLNGKHYYLDSNGAMLTGKHTVPCVFNSDGELI